MIRINELYFDDNNYSVWYRGNNILFLKKEFELLNYLYLNANHTFSRNDLLDAVWTMEFPVDRTVDDHIYRIRKKLKMTACPLLIKTVKGRGYQLVVDVKDDKTSPLVDDLEFQEISARMIKKYHLYGQGEAIESILQQKSFGVENTSDSLVTYALIKGDFHNLLHNHEIELPERLLILLFLYAWTGGSRGKAFTYYSQATQKHEFLNTSNSETTLLAPIFLAIYAKEFSKAEAAITRADISISQENKGLYSFLHITKLLLALCTGEKKEVQLLIQSTESYLKENPYEREIGCFFVLKGLYLLQYGSEQDGRDLIDKGIEITRNTRFVSNLLLVVDTCLFFLSDFIEDPITYQKLKKEWSLLGEMYQLAGLQTEVEKQLIALST